MLQLCLAKVQVTSDRKIITQATDGAECQKKDDNQIMVPVYENKKVGITKQSKSKGEVVSIGESDEPPMGALSQPENFLDQNVMEKFDPTASRELMALSWATFHKDHHTGDTKEPDLTHCKVMTNVNEVASS